MALRAQGLSTQTFLMLLTKHEGCTPPGCRGEGYGFRVPGFRVLGFRVVCENCMESLQRVFKKFVHFKAVGLFAGPRRFPAAPPFSVLALDISQLHSFAFLRSELFKTAPACPSISRV